NFCPSFKWDSIAFNAPENWIEMNPSVTLHGGDLWCNVRCVNYRIDTEGRYLIRGLDDGSVNAENPINTRNFLLKLGKNPFHTPTVNLEVLPPSDFPVEYPYVIGFEDVRLISIDGQLWASSTVRQPHADGNCEQVLTRILREDVGSSSVYQHTDMKRMLRLPRQTEKNWAPLVRSCGDLEFMWRPCEVVNTDGVTVRKFDPGLAVDNISGGSQVIPFRFGKLAITHEARQIPGKPTRYYTHRFVWYDDPWKGAKLSLPFCFNDKGIEFCAGLCWSPNGVDLVISYGYKDEEARIATVSAVEVEKFLW